MVDLGREPEPLRVAGRVGVPLLGLPLALPAARSRGHADRECCCSRSPTGRRTDDVAVSDYSNLFLALHVGLVLAGLAGLTLAAALAGLYLWQERRLKRHEARILRIRLPALVTLDELAARTIAISLPALTLGILAGFVGCPRGRKRRRPDGGDHAAWVVYGTFLFLRWSAGWRERRCAYIAVLGLALVLGVQFGLPLTHFS